MEKDDLINQIRNCPLDIRMNDGEVYRVEKPEFIIVGDYMASILIRRTGAMRPILLSLLNIASVEPHGEHAEN